MTKEQQEAIELTKQFTKMDFNTPNGWTGYYDTELKELSQAMKSVLNMLQEQQEENKKKDKIIEEMAKFMTNKDIDEDICRYQVVEHCKDEKYGVTTNVCINCIKQYFERKAKE